uniref:Uncharacterized protein n=1 Tax=Anopheles farauti TaxID=69004 RepID=A0A182QBU8_9DIPT
MVIVARCVRCTVTEQRVVVRIIGGTIVHTGLLLQQGRIVVILEIAVLLRRLPSMGGRLLATNTTSTATTTTTAAAAAATARALIAVLLFAVVVVVAPAPPAVEVILVAVVVVFSGVSSPSRPRSTTTIFLPAGFIVGARDCSSTPPPLCSLPAVVTSPTLAVCFSLSTTARRLAKKGRECCPTVGSSILVSSAGCDVGDVAQGGSLSCDVSKDAETASVGGAFDAAGGCIVAIVGVVLAVGMIRQWM